jgi:hypothetical protein
MFSINLDLSQIQELSKDIQTSLEAAAKQAGEELAQRTRAKAIELASERLNSRRKKFIDALSLNFEEGVWVLKLDESMAWIDDGIEPHNMIENLLKSPKAKRSKDGSSYLVVPFDHSPGHGATNSTPAQLDLVDTVKAEMKRRKIPWATVERDSQGRPKTGKLHSFHIKNTPLKTGEGPGQGWGPKGDVKQGPNQAQIKGGKSKPGGGGIPFLQGVSVYQTPDGGGGTKRSVMTFRVVSSKQSSPRWDHPGLQPTHLFLDTEKWMWEEFKKMEPEIIQSVLDKL